MKSPVRLASALGHVFRTEALLHQALTHRSFGSPHNERLEFLGDSVLNCVIATQLFQRFPELAEGELSRLRANLVRQDALVRVAQGLQVGDHLRLGEGELKSGGFRRPSILADAVEALIGATYLDGGFEAASRVVERLYESQLAQLDPRESGKDPKTALQEFLQARKLSLPVYTLVGTRGEAHAQEFEVECRVASMELQASGRGSSRRAAEQAAAAAVLDRLKGEAG